MLRDLLKEIFEVLIRLEVVRPRNLSNTVDYGAGLGFPDSFNRVPVLLSLAEGPDAAFRGGVIDRDIAVFQEYTEVFLLVQAVCDHLSGLRFRSNPVL